MKRIDRLVGILLLLHGRKVVRAKDIADHFEISIRTVYRDIRSLEEAGVPLAAQAGEGYSLVSGYHVPPVMFTSEEASALFLGSEFAMRLTDESLQKHIVTALSKIRSVLPSPAREQLERLSDSTEIFIRSHPQRPGFRTDTLAALQEAVVNQYAVKLEYLVGSRNEVSFREVEPLGMLYYDEHWHLIAHCRLRKGLRDFRLDRIKSMATLPEVFKRPPDFSLKEFAQKSMQLENANEVRVKFDKRVGTVAREQTHFGLVEEKEVDDAHLEITFLVRSLEWICFWLLSFGTMVEVIAPAALKQRLHEESVKLALHHKAE